MATKVGGKDGKAPPTAATNLIAGGGAGMMEALVCHPLDTIKVRMQLSRRARQPGAPKRGFLRTGAEIVKRETPLGLYKGLGAVLTGIVPKMAIRFTSFEAYKQMLADRDTKTISGSGTMADPLDVPKYRNAAHALYTVVKEEGVGALYRGVSLTALRQGSNQAVNFTAYTYFKEVLLRWQEKKEGKGNGTAVTLPSWQTTIIGLVSGAMGPLSNAPIDTIKTRLQKTPAEEGVSAFKRISTIAGDMFRQEGFHAFYKGITPRIMRVAPGQAVTFTVYEFLKDKLEKSGPSVISGSRYEE
ncbi:succinate/fumarate mitochondrial transporter [Hypoxylon sp. EC38]|nr:succinate/fumarate mitochondrial transporter [Hypoxylon sp. EC38]